jgi:hypothetical protein
MGTAELGGRVPRRIRLVLAVLTAALSLAAAPPAGAASAPPTLGTVTTTVSGVPGTLAVGSAFDPAFTVQSSSDESVQVVDMCLGMWNFAQHGHQQTRGIEVWWQDPDSGGWVESSAVDNTGEWTLDRSGGIVTIPPHGSVTMHLYIAMSDKAKQGTEYLDAEGACSYRLLDSSGTAVSGVLNDQAPQTSFAYGIANGTANTTGSPTPQPPAAPASTAAAPPAQQQAAPPNTPAADSAGTSVPSQAASPPPSAAATQTPATAAPLIVTAPKPTGRQVPFNATGGGSADSGMDAVPLTVIAAALATFAGAAFVIHRRRTGYGEDPDEER